jgi:serine phosphatase RsbU (regulator of sigma subunit)/integral membrane sensor domain MASE1/anti-sigma regulatory factor (Ser/Thr protein kinase)
MVGVEDASPGDRPVSVHHAPALRLAVALGAYAVGYALLQEVGLTLVSSTTSIAMFWPPAAWAVVWLTLTPFRWWPALIGVQLVVNVTGNVISGDHPLGVASLLSLANLVESTLGAGAAKYLIRRPLGTSSLGRTGAVLACGAVVNTMAGALIGAATVTWVIGAPVNFWTPWRSWWMADAVAVIALGPFVGLTVRGFAARPSLKWIRELTPATLVAAGATLVISVFVFLDEPFRLDGVAAVCLLVPTLVVTAVSGGFSGVALALPGIAIVSAWFTRWGHGPFSSIDAGATEAVFDAQVVIGSFGIAFILTGTAVTALRAAATREARDAAVQAEIEAERRAAVETSRQEQHRRHLAESLFAFTGELTRRFVTVDDLRATIRSYMPGAVLAREARLHSAVDTSTPFPAGSATALAMERGELVVLTPVGQAGAEDARVSAAAAIPLHDHQGGVLDLLEVEWGPDDFDGDVERSLHNAATAIDQSVQRASLFESESRASMESETLRFTAQLLATAATVQDVATRFVEQVAPRLGASGAWSSVITTQEGLRPVASMDTDGPAPEHLLSRAVTGRGPAFGRVERGAQAVALALRTGSEVLGAVALSFPGQNPPEAGDNSLIAATADLVAQAIGRARLYDSEREVVVALQKALLPSALDPGPQFELSVDYRPASSALPAGGDWYDVLPLPQGQTALIVGDVVGQGVGAAAVMGQLRTACAALAPTAANPSELIGRLESFAATIEGADCTSMVVAFLDPATRTLSYSCAGHPPPVLIAPDGQPALLSEAVSAPLCGLRRAPRVDGTAALEPGASVLLYTDGLVERRGEVLDHGLERLLDAARGGARDPAELSQRIIDSLLDDHDAHDDLVLLAIRFSPAERGILSTTFPADLSALRPLRDEIRTGLEAFGVDHDRRDDIVLALCEAAGNAIEHAYRDAEPGTVQVQLWGEEDGSVMAMVRDFGRWQDLPATGPRGRGIEIIRALGQVEVRRNPSGTTVIVRFAETTGVSA